MEIVWTGALWPKELDVTDEYVSRELNEFATELSIMFPQVGAAITTLLPEVWVLWGVLN